MIYLENNVFEEALERIRFIYDNHDDVIVSMSGKNGAEPIALLATTAQPEFMLSLSTAPQPSLQSEVKRKISLCSI